MNGELLSVILFGSAARGDNDEFSDVDILAIVKSKKGRVNNNHLFSRIPAALKSPPPAISWYGSSIYSEMNDSGNLFCWHVYLDGKVLYDPTGFYENLKPPRPYLNAKSDIASFINIAHSVGTELDKGSDSFIYELGVLYVCARNIAMAASYNICKRFDFSRSSPFNLSPSILDYGVNEDMYFRSMLCRAASQRGQEIPFSVEKPLITRYYEQAARWMEAVERANEANA